MLLLSFFFSTLRYALSLSFFYHRSLFCEVKGEKALKRSHTQCLLRLAKVASRFPLSFSLFTYTMADENVPPGITTKQDEIIQYVAKYVVSSCDAARYQDKLRTRTKYNSYFAFLDARHPYHHYYQYLLDSYRYYLVNSEAVNAGGWGGAGDGSDGAQHQLTEEEYYQYYNTYQGQTGEIGFQTGEGDASGYDNGSLQQQQQESANNNSSNGHPMSSAANAGAGISSLGGAPVAADGASAETTGVSGAAQDGGAGAGEAEGEEEEEEYELVMENGEWVSRKRS